MDDDPSAPEREDADERDGADAWDGTDAWGDAADSPRDDTADADGAEPSPPASAWDADGRTDDGRLSPDLAGDDDPSVESDDAALPEPSSAPVERGDPDLESALFVALGAMATILVVVRVVGVLT